MKLKSKLAAVATVLLLLMPNAAYADNSNDRCEQSEDDCREKREKPKFQTKFFSE